MRKRSALTLAVCVALTAAPVFAQAAGTAPALPRADPDYRPQDRDERGLWLEFDELERTVRTSPTVIRDPALNAYVRSVLCRVTGEAECRSIRIYIMRTPQFNASMAPNGMMMVWSGLLLRTRTEAQLASVLGHEYTHYANRHTLKLFRDAKAKSAGAAWLAFTGVGLIASFGLTASLFDYSRDMEREADGGGLALMEAAGYDTREAAAVWEQLRAEMDATAAARNTRSRKDRGHGLFSTHPPSAERVSALRAQAALQPGVPGEDGTVRFREAMAPWWPEFVDDQLKSNDFGASEYLLASLASTGWTPALLYARGELYRRRASGDDLVKAAGFYGEGISSGGTIAQLWRGRGLVRLKLGEAEAGREDLREYLRRAPDAPDKAMIATLTGGAG